MIAETKRQMHEALEMKEDEVAQLRSRLQHATTQKEELQGRKEKAEKSGEWKSTSGYANDTYIYIYIYIYIINMCIYMYVYIYIYIFICFVLSKAFEELERALGVAQRADEARQQLQLRLEEQVQDVERVGEEERKSLQQELTRVKQKVVTIMKVRE